MFVTLLLSFATLYSAFVPIRAEAPIPPDGWWCSPMLGFSRVMTLPYCLRAFYRMPEGDDIVHYTTDAQQGTQSSWTQVPKRYVNDPNNPQCIITIDLQGHSLHSTYVAVAPSVVRAMAASLITKCLELNQGGVRTYGLGNTINEMLIVPTSYDDGSPIDIWGDRSRTISPDSTVESSDGADSVMLVPPGGYGMFYMGLFIFGRLDAVPLLYRRLC